MRARLDVDEIEVYVYKRQLAWLGDISRMSMDRLPRKMLSGWVAAPRPIGAPQFSFGKGIYSALRYAGIKTDRMTVGTNWPEMAQNREAWSCMIDNLPALHAAQTAEQQGASRAASSPLRPAAPPRVFPLTTRENSSSSNDSFINDSSSSSSSSWLHQ